MYKNKDIKILVVLWVIGTACAIVWALSIYGGYNPALPGLAPTEATATTSWVSQPASTIAEKVHNNTAFTIAIITPFLFCPIFTLLYIMVRFSAKNNPTPATFDDNLPLEVVWTIIPAIVLVVMSVPAYGVLRYMENSPKKPDVVVDVVGAQFYWQYAYPRYGVTVTDDGVGTDPMVIPVGQAVQLYGQSYQVNHAWWVPAFGAKFDVIPGRITTFWFRPTKEGFFKGQCAELCGSLHAYMLIHVKVVSEKEYYQWLKDKGAEFPEDEKEKVMALLGPDAFADETVAVAATTTN